MITDIETYFGQIKNKKVIVIGDVMLDQYFYGNVERISPEAPVPLVDVKHQEARLGGAANVALNLKGLEIEPILIGLIGNDRQGELFELEIQENNLCPDFIIKIENRPTCCKTRVYGSNHYLLRFDQEDNSPVTQEIETLIYEKLQTIIRNETISALVFEDYDKGIFTQNLITKIIELCKKFGIPTFVDPKFANFFHYQGVTVFKPNIREFNHAFGLHLQPEEIINLKLGASDWRNKLQTEFLFITLGEWGAVWCNQFMDYFHHIPAQKRKVLDVSGAGDTVIATLVAIWLTDVDTDLKFEIGTLAGGIVVEQKGVVAIKKEELILQLQNLLESKSK